MTSITFDLDGAQVMVESSDGSLLDALRGPLGITSAKDGCSPQGQCGCCTVLVDGEPRVACVTPLRRVDGRQVTTIDGLAPDARERWAEAFCDAGASQCGFCTPGIIVRLEWLRRRGSLADDEAVGRSLAAHLCRCTGWQTIREAATVVARPANRGAMPPRDLGAASRRAAIEGHAAQVVAASVCLGAAPFADDTWPDDALVAVLGPDGSWVLADSVAQSRVSAARVQGRRTTVDAIPPLEVPDGSWDLTLRTSWVEPAYLELDVSWCEPGGEPHTVLANGGAFGGKVGSPLPAIARELAAEHGRAVVARWSREDAVRFGPKRPPIAAGVRADGSGVIRVVRTPGIADAITAAAPGLLVEEVDLVGPPTSTDLRGAGWAEAAVLVAVVTGEREIRSPDGALASAEVVDGAITVRVRCGDPLDPIVLRSFCIGAAHMAYSWVTSESIAVSAAGDIGDLTVRSFGIVRAADMPDVRVEIVPDEGPPVCGSDAVFAAVAAAVWRAHGTPPSWPTGLAVRAG